MWKSLKWNIFVIVCTLSCNFLFSSNDALAQIYLKRALADQSRPEITLSLLQQSLEYSSEYPEYYYLMLEYNDKAESHAEDAQLVELLMQTKDNRFLIEEYKILTKAAEIYTFLHQYEEALAVYSEILEMKEKKLHQDYLNFISCLFSFQHADRQKIADVIQEGFSYYATNEILFYKALYSLKFHDTSFGSPQEVIAVLEDNNYSPQEIAYLKSFLLNDEIHRAKFVDQLLVLEGERQISDVWGREIVYQVLFQYEIRDSAVLQKCLNLWNIWDGNRDFRTFQIVRRENISAFMEEDDNLKIMQKYTGDRYYDPDHNGRNEIVFRMKNGVVIEKIEDHNQDGKPERYSCYHEDGRIDFVEQRIGKKKNRRYLFNPNNSSLSAVEIYRDHQLVKKYYPEKSRYFFEETKALPALEELLAYLDYEEEYGEGIARKKYFGGVPSYLWKDQDGDGVFEYQEIYEKGELQNVFIDFNQDGDVDIVKNYKGGELISLKSKTDLLSNYYTYQEVIKENSVEKYWDLNQDGEFEVKCEEFSSGERIFYFDSDPAEGYEYLCKERNKGEYEIYRMMGKKGVLQSVTEKKRGPKKKGWYLISGRDPETLVTPEQIDFIDDLSGSFVYEGKRSYFTAGLLKGDAFVFRVFRNPMGVFLLDYEGKE